VWGASYWEKGCQALFLSDLGGTTPPHIARIDRLWQHPVSGEPMVCEREREGWGRRTREGARRREGGRERDAERAMLARTRKKMVRNPKHETGARGTGFLVPNTSLICP